MNRRLLLVVLFSALSATAQDDVTAPQDAPEPVAADAPVGEDAPQTEPAEQESLSPRARYNLALSQLGSGQLESAAEEFLAARDEAGPDAELRYRAAFNLGLTLAAQADGQQQDDPEQAIETLRNSAAWFNDAIRLAPEGDEDARVNLEIVLRRIQELADQLNQGKRLEARLDRIIDDQRGLRDRVRQLLAMVESEDAGAEPLGFQREFDELAALERTLLAEAGNIGDLAAEERALIEEKPEAERSQEERVRAFQLQGVDHYVQQARQSLSDTRRRLRRLEGERAHRRADSALAELKRAREQLLDPITVLKGVASDESALLSHTRALALFEGDALRLEEEQMQITAPMWLNTEHLGERQQDLTSRTSEMLARLEAATGARQATSQKPEPEAGQDPDPRQQRMLEAVREAVPFLQTAVAAMQDTQSALATDNLEAAAKGEGDAIQSLLRAIERFAGVRDLIELAYADQARVVQLLTPGEEGPTAELSTEERGRAIGEAVAANRDRLDRLEAMLEEERAAAEAQSEQQAQQQPGQSDPTQADAIRERFELAQQLRSKAAAALEELDDSLAALSSGGGKVQPLPPAKEGLEHVEALRRLFFSIVEHLKELLAEQAETYDQTATLAIETDVDILQAELGLVSERQGGHAGIGGSLAKALAGQADAAGTAEDAQEAGQRLAEAADEVRTATGLMQSAAALTLDAYQRAGAMSPNLEPTLGEQLAAMEHLESAIRLLEPPQQQDPQQDQQDQQQQQQQRQQQQSADEEMTQRQALRRLQAIRDREAERQRRREQQSAQTEPVEKDW